jgi:hypothetical protein
MTYLHNGYPRPKVGQKVRCKESHATDNVPIPILVGRNVTTWSHVI